MTFAQTLHRVLEHYFGDAAFERRDQEQIEKIKAQLLDEVFAEVWNEVWTEIPESLRNRMPDDFRGRIRKSILNRHRAAAAAGRTPTNRTS